MPTNRGNSCGIGSSANSKGAQISTIPVDPSPSDLASALEANLHAQVPLYAQLPGALLCHEPDVLGLPTDLDPSESCVYRAAFTPDQTRERIERVVQGYRSKGCLPMLWIVGLSTRPADIGRYLEAHGFHKVMCTPGMAADLQTLPPPALPGDFVIERVRNIAQLKPWVQIMAAAEELSDALKNSSEQVFERQGLGNDRF